MNIIKHLAALFVLTLILPSCTNLDHVRNDAAHKDSTRIFNESFDKVKAATLTSLQRSNISVKEVTAIEGGAKIMFTTEISIFTMGEVGRVMVLKNAKNQTEVRVRTQKRSRMQVIAPSQKTLALKLFNGIEKALE